MDARARIVITGLVQGVFFRREITDLARRLGVVGWVKNLPDGRVEAIAEGEESKLEELIRFCNVDHRALGYAGLTSSGQIEKEISMDSRSPARNSVLTLGSDRDLVIGRGKWQRSSRLLPKGK